MSGTYTITAECRGRGASPMQSVSSKFNVVLSATPPAPCPADISNPADRVINTADLIVLLARFGQSVTSGTAGDITGDGLVNTADLFALLGVFGQACP